MHLETAAGFEPTRRATTRRRCNQLRHRTVGQEQGLRGGGEQNTLDPEQLARAHMRSGAADPDGQATNLQIQSNQSNFINRWFPVTEFSVLIFCFEALWPLRIKQKFLAPIAGFRQLSALEALLSLHHEIHLYRSLLASFYMFDADCKVIFCNFHFIQLKFMCNFRAFVLRIAEIECFKMGNSQKKSFSTIIFPLQIWMK